MTLQGGDLPFLLMTMMIENLHSCGHYGTYRKFYGILGHALGF